MSIINLTSNDLDLLVSTYEPVSALFNQGHLWSVCTGFESVHEKCPWFIKMTHNYLMESALSQSSRVKGSFFLNSFVAIQQHFNVSIWHSRSTSRYSKSTFNGLQYNQLRLINDSKIKKKRFPESFDYSKKWFSVIYDFPKISSEKRTNWNRKHKSRYRKFFFIMR